MENVEINKIFNGRLTRYSLQLAFLNRLLKEGTIKDEEYTKVKNKLMKDYGVVSDYTA